MGRVPRASKNRLFRIRARRLGALKVRSKQYGINAKVVDDESVRGLDQDSFVFRGTSRSSVGQRALPNAGQQILELRKCLRSKLSAPFALNLLEYFVDFLVCGMSAFGKTDNTHPALVGGVGTRNIPQAFQASEQLVHGLFAPPGPGNWRTAICGKRSSS